MGAGSNPGSPASLPAPSLWLRKAVEEGPRLWEPAPAWETRKWLLASEEDLPLCLSSLYIRLSNEKNNKNKSLKKKKKLLLIWEEERAPTHWFSFHMPTVADTRPH